LEVKINREIRNYTESMFFGLSMRQFVFSLLAIGVAVALYFLLRPYVGLETLSWIVILAAVRCAGLLQLPRHERRAVSPGVVSLGDSGAGAPPGAANQPVLRGAERRHRSS